MKPKLIIGIFLISLLVSTWCYVMLDVFFTDNHNILHSDNEFESDKDLVSELFKTNNYMEGIKELKVTKYSDTEGCIEIVKYSPEGEYKTLNRNNMSTTY